MLGRDWLRHWKNTDIHRHGSIFTGTMILISLHILYKYASDLVSFRGDMNRGGKDRDQIKVSQLNK